MIKNLMERLILTIRQKGSLKMFLQMTRKINKIQIKVNKTKNMKTKMTRIFMEVSSNLNRSFKNLLT